LGEGADNPGSVASYDWFKIFYQRRNIQYQLADRIVCLSEALRLDCEQHGLGSKAVVIPRSVNMSLFCPAESSLLCDLRIELGFDNSPLILFVGRLIFRKGAHRLVPILHHIRKTIPAKLVLVGVGNDNPDGNSCSELVLKQIKSFGLTNEVHLVSYTTRVELYYQVADTFLFPSESEGMPNAVLEAMSSGNPVVCGLIPGITDTMMTHGQSGFVCDHYSDEEYASLIIHLLSESDLRERIGQEARQKIMQEFTESSIFARYQHLYDSL
jgi:glycosyltransferase involved in cell wall biosynthesis